MNYKDSTNIIKESVDIIQLAEMYGVQIKGKMARCPFHDDRNPSASFKNNQFHCYVCNFHLDAMSFVMTMDGCDFKGAKEKLNMMFGLGLDLDKPIETSEMRRIQAERKSKQRELDLFRSEYAQKSEEFRQLYRLKRPIRSFFDEEYAKFFAWSRGRLFELNFWFENNPWR